MKETLKQKVDKLYEERNYAPVIYKFYEAGYSDAKARDIYSSPTYQKAIKDSKKISEYFDGDYNINTKIFDDAFKLGQRDKKDKKDKKISTAVTSQPTNIKEHFKELKLLNKGESLSVNIISAGYHYNGKPEEQPPFKIKPNGDPVKTQFYLREDGINHLTGAVEINGEIISISPCTPNKKLVKDPQEHKSGFDDRLESLDSPSTPDYNYLYLARLALLEKQVEARTESQEYYENLSLQNPNNVQLKTDVDNHQKRLDFESDKCDKMTKNLEQMKVPKNFYY